MDLKFAATILGWTRKSVPSFSQSAGPNLKDFNKEWFLSEMWSVNEEHNQLIEEYANYMTKMENV